MSATAPRTNLSFVPVARWASCCISRKAACGSAKRRLALISQIGPLAVSAKCKACVDADMLAAACSFMRDSNNRVLLTEINATKLASTGEAACDGLHNCDRISSTDRLKAIATLLHLPPSKLDRA